jgi:hypothetical protein
MKIAKKKKKKIILPTVPAIGIAFKGNVKINTVHFKNRRRGRG